MTAQLTRHVCSVKRPLAFTSISITTQTDADDEGKSLTILNLLKCDTKREHSIITPFMLADVYNIV